MYSGMEKEFKRNNKKDELSGSDVKTIIENETFIAITDLKTIEPTNKKINF